MYRYFIKLAYKGTAYHGWQRQPNGVSVQQTLETALTLILRYKVKLTGAGRTDTGVHALIYFAHFDHVQELIDDDRKRLVFKLNSFLSEDIAVYDIFPVSVGSHARFSAKSRTYCYFISREKNPFRYELTYYLFGTIDIDLMNRGADLLLHHSDFTSFSKAGTDTKTNICKIYTATWKECDKELIFTIKADRFLRNMVRAITGTLLELGTGKITLGQMEKIIESRNRSDAGDSVPACGLFLVNIEYPPEIYSG